MKKNWLAVASAEHVRIGRQEGFMQVCHGKKAPLQRMCPGDYVIYYSPSNLFRSKDKLQSFTALGEIKDGEVYSFDMGNGFIPYRRKVNWYETNETSITPLIPHLEFTQHKNWGYQLRFGVIQLSSHDFEYIAQAMNKL